MRKKQVPATHTKEVLEERNRKANEKWLAREKKPRLKSNFSQLYNGEFVDWSVIDPRDTRFFL